MPDFGSSGREEIAGGIRQEGNGGSFNPLFWMQVH
jgi:hypothetical protein